MPEKRTPISKEYLAQLVADKSLTRIAQILGVSDSTVRNWCKMYEIEIPSQAVRARKRSKEALQDVWDLLRSDPDI
jgi:transposase